MYLLDTSIILELLLDQERADQVERLLRNIPPEDLNLSEFSLYSLGIIFVRRKMQDIFLQTVHDMLVAGGIRLVRLAVEDMPDIVHTTQRFNLDFDDAYQCVAARKCHLTIVSFDSDFDRTEQGRKTPAEILEGRDQS